LILFNNQAILPFSFELQHPHMFQQPNNIYMQWEDLGRSPIRVTVLGEEFLNYQEMRFQKLSCASEERLLENAYTFIKVPKLTVRFMN